MKISDLLTKKHVVLSGIVMIISLTFLQAIKDSKARLVKVNGNDVVVCEVDEIKDTIDIPLSSLIESLEIVKLENTEKALIENAWFTDISEKFICIKTYGQFPAKLFDRKG